MKITIGIVTYNRKDSFSRLARSLSRSIKTYHGTKPGLEFLVVDNGANNYAEEILVNSSFNYKIYKGAGNAAEARNIIIKEANGDTIAFIDDDCIVKNNYFEVLHRVSQNLLKDTNAIGIAGNIIRQINKKSILDLAYLASGLDHYFSFKGNSSLVERFSRLRWSPTANIVVKAKIAKGTPFPIINDIACGGEDVLWGYQITQNNHYFISCPELVVFHEPLKIDSSFALNRILDKAFLYGKSEAMITTHIGKSFTHNRALADFIKILPIILSHRFFPQSITKADVSRIKNLIQAYFILGNIHYSLKNASFPRIASLTKLSQHSLLPL